MHTIQVDASVQRVSRVLSLRHVFSNRPGGGGQETLRRSIDENRFAWSAFRPQLQMTSGRIRMRGRPLSSSRMALPQTLMPRGCHGSTLARSSITMFARGFSRKWRYRTVFVRSSPPLTIESRRAVGTWAEAKVLPASHPPLRPRSLARRHRPGGEAQPLPLRQSGTLGVSTGERLEHRVDHPGGPEEPLEDREDVLPEAVCLLPEPDPGPEDAQGIDRPSARGPCAGVAHRRSHLSPGSPRHARPPTGTPRSPRPAGRAFLQKSYRRRCPTSRAEGRLTTCAGGSARRRHLPR